MPFDGTMLPQVATDLIAAKNYIVRNGWCSEGPKSGQRVCMARAYGLVVRGGNEGVPDDSQTERMKVIRLALHRAIGITGVDDCHGTSIGQWNDAPGRTLEEVYAAFDSAIANNV